MWIIFPILFMFVVFITFIINKLIKRALNEFSVNIQKKRTKILIWIISAIVAIATTNMFSFLSIIILHILALTGVMQFINFVIKKLTKEKYNHFNIWKKIHALCIIPIIATIIIMTAGYINLHNVQQTNYTIHTLKHIREEGYRIALLADIHYEVSIDRNELQKKCDEISNQNVDIVVLCGDIVDDNTSKEGMYEVFETLSTIKSSFGIFYVYGNHDRQLYSSDKNFSPNELKSAIEGNGITILQDQVYQVSDDFTIIGREDISVERISQGNMTNKRKTLHELLKNVDKQTFVLTLDHQPKDYTNNRSIGTDLMLSGHTHGGQIWPVNILDKIFKFNELSYGLYDDGYASRAIVTSGVAGWNYPVKTAAPAEYVIIDILPYK